MGSRIELQLLLEQILGSRNVYFQPPEGKRMDFPAIKYSLARINSRRANNDAYLRERSYEITLIDPDPDSRFIDEILKLPYCSFDRSLKSDNLNHFYFTLYY